MFLLANGDGELAAWIGHMVTRTVTVLMDQVTAWVDKILCTCSVKSNNRIIVILFCSLECFFLLWNGRPHRAENKHR